MNTSNPHESTSTPRFALVTTLLITVVLAFAASFYTNPLNSKPLVAFNLDLPKFQLTSWIIKEEVLPDTVAVDIAPLITSEPTVQDTQTTDSSQSNKRKPKAVINAVSKDSCKFFDRRAAVISSLKSSEDSARQPSHPLELPCVQITDGGQGCARYTLDDYWQKLDHRLVKGRAITLRWSQFGDSLVAKDHWSQEFRTILHAQFGDGGHGFLTTGRPPNGYGTGTYRVKASGWYSRVMRPWGPYPFGPGGLTFESSNHARTSVRGTKQATGFDVVGILYEGKDAPQKASLKSGSTDVELVFKPAQGPQLHWVNLSSPAKNLTLRWRSRRSHVHGLYLQRKGSGYVVDNFGMVSGQPAELIRFKEDRWGEFVKQLTPDLVSFWYGGAGIVRYAGAARRSHQPWYFRPPPKPWLDEQEAAYLEVIRRLKTSSPNSDCLILAHLTRGTKSSKDGSALVLASVAPTVEMQRQVANKAKCGFWDSFTAMGGAEGLQQWLQSRDIGSDLRHPTKRGYRRLARMLHASMMKSFRQYLERVQAKSQSECGNHKDRNDQLSPKLPKGN